MNSEIRIIELLTDILQEQRSILQEQRSTNNHLDKLEGQQAKTNLVIGELRLSVMQLAEKLEITSQHDKRITRLEEVVFHA